MSRSGPFVFDWARIAVAVTTGAAALAVCIDSRAAEWDVGVNLDAGIIHSDNVFLDADGDEVDDIIYLVAPELYAQTDDQRLKAEFRYRPEAVFYSDHPDSDEVFHVFDGQLTGTLVPERFFLYLSAVNFQSVVTPELRVPLNNLNISQNRVDSLVYRIRPYWQQPIGSAELLVSAGYTGVEYDDELFQTSEEKDAYVSLDNLERQEGLAWQLDYRYRSIEYEVTQPFEFQRASLNLGYWFTSSFRLFASGGKETPFDRFADASMDSDFWEAGFQYTPSSRVNLELAAGDRSYGNSYRANFRYEFRRGQFNLNYSETPTTRTELVFDRRPILEDRPIDGAIDQPGSADRLVLKRGEASISLNTPKTEFSVRAFYEGAENVATADDTPLEDEFLSGVGANFDWKVGSKTTLYVSGDAGSRETQRLLPNNELTFYDDELTLYRGGIGYQATRKILLRIEYSRADQDAATAGEEYVETQYRLLFRGMF